MKCTFCHSEKLKIHLQAKIFNIKVCRSCDVAFTDPAPVMPDYKQMDFHSGEVKDQTEQLKTVHDLPFEWQRLINVQVEMITKNFGKDVAILEIGCGEGILLEELKKSGFQNVQGIEPSINASIRASRKSLQVHNGYFEKEVFPQKFDLVIMSHVFEHIAKPLAFLADIKSCLTVEGSIMLTQTNYRGLIPSLRKEAWYAWVPDQHFWHFTLDGLGKLFKQNNFKLVDYSFSSLVHKQTILYKVSNLKSNWRDQFIALFRHDY